MIRAAKILFFILLVFSLFSVQLSNPPSVKAANIPCSLLINTSNLVVGQGYPVKIHLDGDVNTLRSDNWIMDLVNVNDNAILGQVKKFTAGEMANDLTVVFTPTQPGVVYLNFHPEGTTLTVNDCSTNDDLTVTAAGAPTPTSQPGTICYDITNDSAAGWSCSIKDCPTAYQGANAYDACQADLAIQHPTPTGPPGADLITPFPTQVAAPPPPCADYDLVKGRCKKADTALGLICTEAGCFIQSLFAILLSLSGGSAIIVMIYAGYLFMTSRGNPEGIQKAREIIISAIIGLLFIVFSYVIMEAITGDLLHLPGFDVFNQCNDRNHQC